MARGCDCTIGWVTDPDAKGTAVMEPISCKEYREVLWKIATYGVDSLNVRMGRIHRKAIDEGWG